MDIKIKTPYWSREINEPISSVTHSIAIFFSVSAATLLITFAYLWGTKMHLIGFTIFGIALIFLYLISSVYHFFRKETKIKKIFQQIDHSMIFIFIASAYTPIALTIDNRTCGISLLIAAWTFAIIGFGLKASNIKMNDWISTSLYIAMGGLIIFVIKPVMAWLPHSARGWLFGGGLFYLIGVIFFMLEDRIKNKYKFGMHETFHIFVMAGTFCNFWLLLRYVLYL